MGSTRKMSRAELRQRDMAQQDPRWLAWLAGMDADLEVFFAEDAPEIAGLPDRWSADGLRLAGAAAVAVFGDIPTLYDPVNRSTTDRFIRYVGECYCRHVEGTWTNVPANGPAGQPFWPVVDPPASGYIYPRKQLALAFFKPSKRDPGHPEGEMAWAFGNSREDYEKWVAAGQPDAERQPLMPATPPPPAADLGRILDFWTGWRVADQVIVR